MPEGNIIHRIARIHRRWLEGREFTRAGAAAHRATPISRLELASRALFFCEHCQSTGSGARRARRAQATR